MSEILTPGQTRLREILNEYLAEYRQLKERKESAAFGSIEHEIYHTRKSEIGEEIRRRFASEKIIKEDNITGRDIKRCNISRNYLNWLEMTGEERTIKSNYPRVKLDKFILDVDTYSNYSAYTGGEKSSTTFSVLLALANDEKITRNINWDSVYYSDEGILTLGMGGCHRQLAHILYGQTEMNPSSMTIYENSLVNKKLHSSLLSLERITEECDHYFDWDTPTYDKKLFEKMQKEAEEIVEFITNTTLEEIEIIKASIIQEVGWPSKKLTIRDFIERRNDIQSVKEMTKLDVWIIKFKDRMGIKILGMTPIKRWLLGISS